MIVFKDGTSISHSFDYMDDPKAPLLHYKARFWDQAVGMLNTALAGYGQGESERKNAAEAHDWSKEDAQHERQWQESMSNSAHQREVKDLRDAGLNPILSAGKSGAATGSVGLPSIDRARGTSFGNMVGTAMEIAQQKAQTALLKTQEEATASAGEASRAQARKTNKEADILGPKSMMYNKVEEAIKSSIKSFDTESKAAKNNPNLKAWGEQKTKEMKGKP